MRHHNPFGRAGRAGSIHHIGDAFPRHLGLSHAAVRWERIGVQNGQVRIRQFRAIAQQNGNPSVFGHEFQPFRRQRHIKGHISRPGLQHRHHRHRQHHRTLRGDPHQTTRHHALFDQPGSQGIGTRVQRGVIHAVIAKTHRNPRAHFAGNGPKSGHDLDRVCLSSRIGQGLIARPVRGYMFVH